MACARTGRLLGDNGDPPSYGIDGERLCTLRAEPEMLDFGLILKGKEAAGAIMQEQGAAFPVRTVCQYSSPPRRERLTWLQ